jgi:probable HAF family extracellular repeat protein
MSFSKFGRSIANAFRTRAARVIRPRPPHGVEGLEARQLFSTYTFSDLGVLPGDYASYPEDVNNLGQVVGFSRGTSVERAFLYSGGALTDLGTGDQSVASAINDQGVVVGMRTDADGTPGYAPFRYAGGTFATLPGLASATDINNNGQISGSTHVPGSLYDDRAAFADGTTVIDLHPSWDTDPAGSTGAVAISQDGTKVAGNGEDPMPGGVGQYAFVYSGGTATRIPELPPVDTTHGSFATRATDVNDRGDVVGYSGGHAFFYSNGSTVDLGSLGTGLSAAEGINNLGHVVGMTNLDNGDTDRAFIYRDGVMTDLNTLVSNRTPAPLVGAKAISDAGHVTGLYRARDGSYHGYLLTPDAPTGSGDTTAPTADTHAGTLRRDADGIYTLKVTYTDDTAIDAGSLGTGDLLVTGPNGYSQFARFVDSGLTDDRRLSVTYQILATDGLWDFADNGLYTISIVAGEVTDTSGNAVAAGELDTFVVAFRR